MGDSIRYKCEKCGNEEELTVGIGMFYPADLEKAKKLALDGKLGKDIEEAVKSNPNSRVEAERFVYACKGCGYITSDPSYTVSYPKSEFKNDFTLDIWNKDDYRVIKTYAHKCPECGKRMAKIVNPAGKQLKCSKCKLPVIIDAGLIMWD